jgi:hypothetical protein
VLLTVSTFFTGVGEELMFRGVVLQAMRDRYRESKAGAPPISSPSTTGAAAASGSEFVEHLPDSLLTRFRPLCSSDPTEVVVSLVPRTPLVVGHHVSLGEPIPYISRHGIESTMGHATITPRIDWTGKRRGSVASSRAGP